MSLVVVMELLRAEARLLEFPSLVRESLNCSKCFYENVFNSDGLSLKIYFMALKRVEEK